MTNYEIKNYNHYAETMCGLIARELELDEMTKAVLKASVYSKHYCLIWKMIAEEYGAEKMIAEEYEALEAHFDYALRNLDSLGLLIRNKTCHKLHIPAYDELMEMKRVMEEMGEEL